MVREWPFRKEGGCAHAKQYYTFAFFDQMPKLNTNNPKVREYLIGVCENWVRNYDVDGIHADDYFYPQFTEDNVKNSFDGTAAAAETAETGTVYPGRDMA